METAESIESVAKTDFATAGGLDALTAELLRVSADVEPDMVDLGCDEPTICVRLRYRKGIFALHTGDSQYDQDHRGSWGSSFVVADETEESAREIAEDLIYQVIDHLPGQG